MRKVQLKSIAVLAMLAALALVLATGCGSSSDSKTTTSGGSTTASARQVKVTLLMPALDNEAWKADANFMKEAAASDGNIDFEVLAGSSATDLNSQLANLQNALAKQPDALIVLAQDPKALGKPLQKASEQTKIITFANVVPGLDSTSDIAFPDLDGGRTAGEYFASVVPRGAKIGILHCAPGSYPNIDDRVAGAKSEWTDMDYDIVGIADACPGGAGDQSTARRAMADLLTAHPDLQGLYSVSDSLVLGALGAIERAGKQVTVVSYDAQPAALAKVKSGGISGDVDIRIKAGAIAALETAAKAARGETVPQTVNVPAQIVTQDNVDQVLAGN